MALGWLAITIPCYTARVVQGTVSERRVDARDGQS